MTTIKIHKPQQIFKSSKLSVVNYLLYFTLIGLFCFAVWNNIDPIKFAIYSTILILGVIISLIIDYFNNSILLYDEYIIYKTGNKENKIFYNEIKSCEASLLKGFIITTPEPKKFIKAPIPNNSDLLIKIIREKCLA